MGLATAALTHPLHSASPHSPAEPDLIIGKAARDPLLRDLSGNVPFAVEPRRLRTVAAAVRLRPMSV